MSERPAICPPLPSALYENSESSVSWAARDVGLQAIDYFKSGALATRLTDLEARDELEAEIRSAAATEVADALVCDLLASDPDPEPWQIGEAMAEVLLEQWHDAVWIWNQGNDRRTPKASLPGADIVGFRTSHDGARFLFGEVKSSRDPSNPPGVLTGRKGMIHQLETLLTTPAHVWTLIRWLRARCSEQAAIDLYRQALEHHVGSKGKALLLVGCLMRDTQPNEKDVSNRGKALAKATGAEATVELHVWHLPHPLNDWADYLEMPA